MVVGQGWVLLQSLQILVVDDVCLNCWWMVDHLNLPPGLEELLAHI